MAFFIEELIKIKKIQIVAKKFSVYILLSNEFYGCLSLISPINLTILSILK